MKRIKRLGALIVSFAIALSIIVPASAVSTNDSTVFLKQNTGSTCTLSAAAMMLRRRAILDGSSNWSSITESNLKPTAWVTGQGARFNYTYNGVSVTTKSLKNFSGDKKEYFISMLSAHPEGIVVYNHSKPHAVLLTDYDATTDTFYCADPSTAAPNGRIKFLNSRIPGDTQDSKISNISQIWYIKSGKTISPITVKTSQSGHWAVSVPSHYKLFCYSSADAAKNSTYIKAQSERYVLSCTKLAILSNGKTRYFFVSGDKKSLWFDYDANYMSVTESPGETSHKQYTVYFDPNGGVVSQTSKTVAAGSIVGSMPTPTREGYTFLGWSTSKNTSGLLLRTGDEMVVEKDTTLYAEWKEVSKVTRVTRTSQLNIRNMETSENTAEGWSWNKETKTLTLDNVNFVVADEPSALICNEATIILTGTNTITSTYNNTKESSITCGILSRAGNLVFKGTGTLTVTGGTSKGSSHGIALTSTGGGQHMTIDGPSITAIGGTSTKFSCSGVEAYDLIISNGSLTAIGGSASDSSNGVYCKGGNLTINGGYLKATSGTSKRNQYDYDETAIQLYGEHCTISCGDNIAIKTPIGGKSSVVTVGGHPRTIVVDSSNVPAKEIVIE